MTWHTIFSQVQIKPKSKTVAKSRPMTYCYTLSLLLVAAVILTALVSCVSAPAGVLPASPEQPAITAAPPEQPGTSEPNPTTSTEPVAAEQVSYVTSEELLQKIGSGGVLVIDVRLKESYDADHIKGAISIPLSTIEAGEFVLPPTNEIVLYCGCPNEESSTKAALELIKQGFSGVKVLKGGYTAWKEKAFPTQTGG